MVNFFAIRRISPLLYQFFKVNFQDERFNFIFVLIIGFLGTHHSEVVYSSHIALVFRQGVQRSWGS